MRTTIPARGIVIAAARYPKNCFVTFQSNINFLTRNIKSAPAKINPRADVLLYEKNIEGTTSIPNPTRRRVFSYFFKYFLQSIYPAKSIYIIVINTEKRIGPPKVA